ncbi:MAG: molybdenum cofactor biosynthesis protein MoaE [Campylobacterales bacterium]
MRRVEIRDGGLAVEEILSSWYSEIKDKNLGAFVPFVGIVRDEDSIEGLSFDIYEPILAKWFDTWQIKAEGELFMAHSRGDVWLHESSFIAAIASRKRRFALEFIDEFVEDFKRSAPIWKYDMVEGKRVYAKDRSYKIDGAGLFN